MVESTPLSSAELLIPAEPTSRIPRGPITCPYTSLMVLASDATNATPRMITARLELSFGSDEDAATLFPYVHGDPGRAVTDTLLWDGPARVEDISSFFRNHATGTWAVEGFHWVLRDRDGTLSGTAGTAIGSIGIRVGVADDECDIGYWLAPPFWGQGLMPEAIAAVARHAFDLGFCAVGADVFSFNQRGQRLLEKLGFQRIAELPAYVTKRGKPIDGVRFRVTREELVVPT